LAVEDTKGRRKARGPWEKKGEKGTELRAREVEYLHVAKGLSKRATDGWSMESRNKDYPGEIALQYKLGARPGNQNGNI